MQMPVQQKGPFWLQGGPPLLRPVVQDPAARASGAVTRKMMGMATSPMPINALRRDSLEPIPGVFSSNPASAKWPSACATMSASAQSCQRWRPPSALRHTGSRCGRPGHSDSRPGVSRRRRAAFHRPSAQSQRHRAGAAGRTRAGWTLSINLALDSTRIRYAWKRGTNGGMADVNAVRRRDYGRAKNQSPTIRRLAALPLKFSGWVHSPGALRLSGGAWRRVDFRFNPAYGNRAYDSTHAFGSNCGAQRISSPEIQGGERHYAHAAVHREHATCRKSAEFRLLWRDANGFDPRACSRPCSLLRLRAVPVAAAARSRPSSVSPAPRLNCRLGGAR